MFLVLRNHYVMVLVWRNHYVVVLVLRNHFLGYRQQLSNLIDDQDFYVTIIATPTANQFQENCLYESNV